MRVLGFTGTQAGLTDRQEDTLALLFRFHISGVLLNGMEAHADAAAARLARSHGYHIIGLPGAPPGDPSRCPDELMDEIEEVRPELDRNGEIARRGENLLACPRQARRFIRERSAARDVPLERVVIRSGTWATVRYAVAANRLVWLIWPDGEIDLIGGP